jgi:hypothetical protein
MPGIRRLPWISWEKGERKMPSDEATNPNTLSNSVKHTDYLFQRWMRRLRRAQVAHYKAATHFERLHYWIGVPVVILSTLVGTSVFATLQKDAGTSMKVAIGTASITAAIMAALQTFLRYAERAERHRATAIKYGALKQTMELKGFLYNTPEQVKIFEDFLYSKLETWNRLNEDSPTLPKSIYDRVYSMHDKEFADLPWHETDASY